MASMITRSGSMLGAQLAYGAWLTGALMALAEPSVAQDASELGNLVFAPVLLSSAGNITISPGGASAGTNDALQDSASGYLAVIEQQRQAGSTGLELIEPLGLLAVAYQGLGRHEQALEVLEEAIALTVENRGADNLEQIPLQEQKIPSYLALDDIRSVDDTEERVYSLNQEFYEPDSRQMYYATINLADWNTAAYFKENYRADGRPLQRQLAVIDRAPRAIGDIAGGTNRIFDGSIRDVFDQDINDPRLRKIDRLYKDYQDAISEGENAQLDVVIDIAKRIARLSYITRQEMDFERYNNAFVPNYDGSREQAARNSPRRMEESYESGEAALKYVISVLRSVEGVRQEALAAAFLDLGDWHLAYGKAQAAKDAYGQAYQALLDAGFAAENIDRALATDIPVQIPVIATHLYSRASRGIRADAELVYRGYLDLSFTVNELGNAGSLEFRGSSAEDSDAVERLIGLQMRSMKFRPVLDGGQLSSPGRIEARYFYSY
jgi:hypothetical protein